MDKIVESQNVAKPRVSIVGFKDRCSELRRQLADSDAKDEVYEENASLMGFSPESLGEKIRHFCGVVDHVGSYNDYKNLHALVETDIIVLDNTNVNAPDILLDDGLAESRIRASDASSAGTRKRPHLIIIGGKREVQWGIMGIKAGGIVEERYFFSATTERELSVGKETPACMLNVARKSSLFRHKDIFVSNVRNGFLKNLVSTTSQGAVAAMSGDSQNGMVFFIPVDCYTLEWLFAIFQFLNNESDPAVPSMPNKTASSGWLLPEEIAIQDLISDKNNKIEFLLEEVERLEQDLANKIKYNDNHGIRRAIYGSGAELEDVVGKILSDIGFGVEFMTVPDGEQKMEDIRLTLANNQAWESIVEIKGYTGSVKSNDFLQVGKHRSFYVRENGREPDMSILIVNNDRKSDPVTRVPISKDADSHAAAAQTVCISSLDLYKQWLRVQNGDVSATDVLDTIVNAQPGLLKF